jgi:drug/metabolite transporter (DMT)-like permease
VWNTRSNLAITLGIATAMVLWGINNVAIRFMVQNWPPLFTAVTRMFCISAILLAVLRWTRWLGEPKPLSRKLHWEVWRQAGVWQATFVVLFSYALYFTGAARVGLVLAASPVWAVLLERKSGGMARKYLAAALAVIGIGLLLTPSLDGAVADWRGDVCALASSLAWVMFGRQCKGLGEHLSGVEVTGHTMWRAAVLMSPWAIYEAATHTLPPRPELFLVQTYCIVFGGVIAFSLHYHALRCWPMSRVFLWGNLLPITTMAAAWLILNEAVSGTFWIATALVAAAVAVGQSGRSRS